MFDERLPTHLWVQAGLALCSGRGIPAMVLNKGDPHTGVVLVKVATLDGKSRLLAQQRDVNGTMQWVDAFPNNNAPDEKEADSYITRAKDRDPDLWVIEVEDRSGVNPFENA